MKLIREEHDGRKLRPCSSPWLGCSQNVIFRPEVFDVVGKYLRGNGELLPADCPGHDLYFFNAKVVDALDESNSAIKHFKDGCIYFIECHKFKNEVVENLPIFKIPNCRVSEIFVNGDFVDAWCNSNLTGLDFVLLWDSSLSPISSSIGDRLTGNLPHRRGKSA
jgi:hypothetical protein